MEDFIQDWGLTAAIFLPLVGAGIMMLIPREEESAHKFVALVTSLATFAIGVAVLLEFDYDKAGELQFTRANEWIGDDKEVLAANSPTRRAASIKVPVLLAAGREDETAGEK